MKNEGRKSPWTTAELFRTVRDMLDLPDCLDYANPVSNSNNQEIRTECFRLEESLEYGGNEGIYLTFGLRFEDDKYFSLGTFKTLGEDRTTMRSMALLMADFIYTFERFANENVNDFDWSGYGIREVFADGSTACVEYCCPTLDRAKEKAKQYLDGKTVRIIDKSTRKYKTYRVVDHTLLANAG